MISVVSSEANLPSNIRMLGSLQGSVCEAVICQIVHKVTFNLRIQVVGAGVGHQRNVLGLREVSFLIENKVYEIACVQGTRATPYEQGGMRDKSAREGGSAAGRECWRVTAADTVALLQWHEGHPRTDGLPSRVPTRSPFRCICSIHSHFISGRAGLLLASFVHGQNVRPLIPRLSARRLRCHRRRRR